MTPPPYIGPPPPYTAVKPPHENIQLSTINSEHISQPILTSNITGTQNECSCSNSYPQTSQQHIEPPPAYGVYTDIAHVSRPRT